MAIVSEGGTLAEKGFSLTSNVAITDGVITIQSNKLQYINLIRDDSAEITLDYLRQTVSKILVNNVEFNLASFDGSNTFVDVEGAGIQIRFSITGGALRFNIAKAASNDVNGNIVVTIVFPSGSSIEEQFELSTTAYGDSEGTVTTPIKTANDNEYYIAATPNPGYAFDYWEYRTSEDNTTWNDNDWAVYNGLTSSKGTVTLTKHTQLRAHFKPASVKLGELTIGAVEKLSDPSWAPTDANVTYVGYHNGGFFAAYYSQSVSGSPSIGEPAMLGFQWYPVGILQTPSSSYYLGRFNLLTQDDFCMVTFRLYAGEGIDEENLILEKTTSLWLQGNPNKKTVVSNEGPYYGSLTFIMPDSGQLTLSMQINNQEPSVRTLTIYDDTQYQAIKDLSDYYTTTFGSNPPGAEDLPDNKYKEYSDVRILLENAYNLGRESIAAAESAEDVIQAYAAVMDRLNQLQELQEQINAGNGEYYRDVDGVLKIAVYVTNNANFAYVPTLAYEYTTRNFNAVVTDEQARAYIALTASLEAANPGIWKIGYGSTPDPYDIYITSIGRSGGDGNAFKGSPSGAVCYTHNSGFSNGFSIQALDDRDAIRVGGAEGGQFPDLKTRPDKDELLWAVAAAKEQIPLATLEASEAYQNALLNLRGWDAYGCNIETLKDEQQAVIDAALAELKAAFPDANLERWLVSAEAREVIRLINAIGTVTRESKEAIEAAEEAYAALTAEQKDEVSNYQTLTAARRTYDTLMSLSGSDPTEALNGVLAYLVNNVTAFNVGAQGSGEWVVLAMARGGVITPDAKANYLAALDTALAGSTLAQWTDYERVTLALSALGVDASAYGTESKDLTANYKLYADPTARSEENQTLMADIYALIALNAKPYESEAREDYISRIIRAEKNGGGWNHADSSKKADVDSTAMTIQALAPYYGVKDSVTAAVDRALSWLKAQQDPYTGGFGESGVVNTESTAQVVAALCALEIDPAGKDWTVDGMNPLSALTIWYNGETGKFGHVNADYDPLATEQAAYALVAWKRYVDNSYSLYDMRDAFTDEKSDDTSIRSLTVCGVKAGEVDGAWTVELAHDTILEDLTVNDFDIRPAIGAKVNSLAASNDGSSWTFTVTAENGTTTQDYTVTVTMAAAPNTENAKDVADAIAAIQELATLNPIASTDANTAETVSDWISAKINDTVSSYEVAASLTVAPADFVAAVDGTAENKTGTSGSFKATISIYKGSLGADEYASDTFEITNGVITPKVFVSSDATISAITCNGEAGTITDETVTIVLPYTTEALPTSADAFTITTTDADAVPGELTASDGGATWTITITAEDMETTKTYTINVSIATDPLSGSRTTLATAKAAIEEHAFTVLASTANSEENALTWLQAEVNTLAAALDGKTVTDLTVTPAVNGAAGSAETWDGTPGSFTFTVTLSINYEAFNDESGTEYEAGTLTDTTATITGTITPVAYTPSPDTSVVSLTVEGATVTEDAANYSFDAVLPFGSELSSVTKDSFTIEVAAGARVTAEPSVAADGKTWTFTVTAENGTVEQQYTVNVSVSTDDTEYVKAQNQAAVDEAAALIPATLTATYNEVSVQTQARPFIIETLNALGLGESITPSVTISNFIAAKEGTESNPNGTDGSFTATVTLSKGADATLATAEATISVTIKAPVDPNTQITVTFRLVGAYPAEEDVDLSTSTYMPDYVTWIPSTEYTIAIGSTMYDLFTMAMEDAGLECEYKDQTHSYVATVYAPDVLTGYALSEKTNGARSGWMYSVNGSHPGIGLNGYYFSSDDSIVETGTADVVWHYVNDFSYEVSDWEDGSQGDASYWNKWLDAPIAAAVPATSIGLSETGLSLVEGENADLTAAVTPFYALVTWSSSDKDVATVDANGKVTAVGAGDATITVASVAGEKSASCEVSVTAAEVPVEGVTLDQSEASVVENETVTLKATISPANATIQTVTWSSSNEDVATVDASGKVTGVSEGSATITASAGGKSASCEVKVTAAVIPVSGITLNRDTATINEKGTITLTATVSPDNATNPDVTWTSSDEDVATVDASGKVTGVKAGTATITASAGDKSASCVVTVEAEPISEYDPENVLAGVLGYLKGSVTNPAVSSTGGEWAVLAMARGGVITDAARSAYLANLDSRLADTADPIPQYTDYERITLALSALGVNASAYGEEETDLTAVYKAFVDPSERSTDDQSLMADIFALIALDTKPYDSEARDAYISCILDAEKSGGGWNHAKASTTADADTTAMAIQALAPYYGKNEDVTKAVDRALSWLKAQQDPYTGGYGKSGVVNTESTAQVVAALCALNIDPAGTDWTVDDDMNPLSALTSWYNTQKGWFGHTGASFDQMATEQAAYALVAWKRWTDKENSLYDMSDAFVASGDASVRSLTVCGIAAAGEDNSFTVILPYGTDLADLSASDFSIRPAAGAKNSSPVTTDGGKTWSFTVTAENGTTKQTYTVTLSVAADPLSGAKQTVVNVKSAIENHTFTVSSETANTKNEIAAWLQVEVDDLAAALDGKTVTGLSVTPAVDGEAGSSETWAGTDGSFSFTVNLSLDYAAGTDESGAAYEAGTIEDVTATITGTITAAAYTPSADAGVVSLSVEGATVTADDTNHSFAAVLPYGTELDSLTKNSFTITPADGATGTDPVTKDGGATWTFTVTAENGTTKQTYTVSVSVSDDDTEFVKEQNEAAVAAVKDEIPAAMTASAQDVSNAQTAKSFVLAALAGLELDDTVSRSVKISGFTAAEDGDETDPDGTDGGFTATVTLTKGEGETQAAAEVTISVTVTAKAYVDPNETITVSFRLIGAYPAEKDVDLSKSDYAPEYVTWIPTTEYTIAIGSTMYDLFTMAMEDAGLEYEFSDPKTHNYVATVYAPDVLTGYELSEFTNGVNSGWMYTVNGKTAGVGLADYKFSSDDEIVASRKAEVVWHYVNDYAYEVSDWATGSAGDESTWDKWLDAEDKAPAAVPATSFELSETEISLAEDETVTLTAAVAPSYALVTWTSSDEDVATVDADGKVTAVCAGTATITAKAGKLTATCEVTVTAAAVPEANIEYVGGTEEEPIAEVTSTVETTVNDEGEETKTATLTVVSEKTNSAGEVVDNPCVVMVKNPDGSFELLEAVENPDGGYDYVKEDYTEDMEFIVAVEGDYTGDGEFKTIDLAKANLDIIAKKEIDPMKVMIMGVDGEKLRTVHLAKLNLLLVNEELR